MHKQLMSVWVWHVLAYCQTLWSLEFSHWQQMEAFVHLNYFFKIVIVAIPYLHITVEMVSHIDQLCQSEYLELAGCLWSNHEHKRLLSAVDHFHIHPWTVDHFCTWGNQVQLQPFSPLGFSLMVIHGSKYKGNGWFDWCVNGYVCACEIHFTCLHNMGWKFFNIFC